MDFDLTEEQQEFRKAVREFAEEVIAPRAEEMDRLEEFPLDIVKQMGEMGLFGLPFPEEYGGQGSDFLTFSIAVEELARVDSSMAITLEAGVGLGANPIYTEGTEEQIAWLYGWWSRIDAWISDKVTEADEVLDDLSEEIAAPPTSDLSDPSTTLP